MYESFGIFCPSNELQHLDLIFTEDILINWSKPVYMNFTHCRIMERIEDFYAHKGTIEKLYGDVHVKENEYLNDAIDP